MSKTTKYVKSSVESLQEIDKLTSELHPSVHYDYTQQIATVMKNHADTCADLGRRFPLRAYMWDLFAVTMLMQIEDKYTRVGMDYPTDKYSNMDDMTLIELARNELDNILTGKHDTKLISDEQEDISTYEYSDTQKLVNILKACYMASIAFMKIRDYEKLFTLPETEGDSNGTGTQTT